MSKTKNKASVLQPLMQPVLKWLIENQDDRHELESRLRQTLGSQGVADKHLKGLVALDVDGSDFFASSLGASNKVRRLLPALEVIGQCRFADGTVSKKQLAGLADLLVAKLVATKIDRGTLIRLIKAWMDSFEEISVLEDVMNWAASSGQTISKKAGWESIVRRRWSGVVFSSPADFPDEIADVTVKRLQTIDALIKEGDEMGHCLGADTVWLYASRALAKNASFFHLNRVGLPNICATLEIELHDDGWKIGDFETVGRGTPTPELNLAAKKLIALVNKNQGFNPAIGDDMDWDDEIEAID